MVLGWTWVKNVAIEWGVSDRQRAMILRDIHRVTLSGIFQRNLRYFSLLQSLVIKGSKKPPVGICIYMYIYVYMCIYIYMCVYMYMCIYMYMYIYIYVYVYINVCICIYMYIYVYIYMYFFFFLIFFLTRDITSCHAKCSESTCH